MKRFLSITALCLFSVSLLAFSGFAQDYKGKGRVVGYVYDEQGNPLEGVTVKLFSHRAQGGFEVKTDGEGKWVAAWIRGGGWDVDFEKIGYAPKKIFIQVKEYGRNPEVKVNLKKVEGLVITDELKELLTEGNNLYNQGQYQEAISIYQKILGQFPDAYVINKNIGNAYFQLEDYDQAEEYYKKVLEKDPNNNEAKMLIGNCYVNRGENEKALEWYNQISFDDIDDPIVLYNIGTNYYNLGKYDDALRYYKKAVEIQPDFLDGLYQLGLAYLTTQRYQESIVAFEKYLQQDSESGRAEQVKNFLTFLKTKIK
ncbi:MAG TPA: tetratricopeptide repeat protein [Candidatus Aminicenantes bacterium]|nr:tetratricopeptide repeat protein [Candidatus Aminicenantes bacterium]